MSTDSEHSEKDELITIPDSPNASQRSPHRPRSNPSPSAKKYLDLEAVKTSNGARGWVFTLNNYSSVDVPRAVEGVKYAIWQAEKGEKGTKHLQGYFLFESTKRLPGVKKIFPTAHWEIRRGTHEQARDYCSKEETRVEGPWTLGEEPSQGARSDLLSLKRSIDEGKTEIEIWDQHFASMLKYHKGATIYRQLKSEVRNFKTFVTVITGPTGSGKSHAAHTFPNVYSLSHPGTKGGQVWFDRYDGHQTVVIDEFYGWIPYDLLLRLLDRFPLAVPIKGGFANFRPRFIVITSNKAPEDWYKFEKFAGKSDPLLRRMDLIITKWSRNVYQVLKSPESPNATIEIQEDNIDFKRFVPNFPQSDSDVNQFAL